MNKRGILTMTLAILAFVFCQVNYAKAGNGSYQFSGKDTTSCCDTLYSVSIYGSSSLCEGDTTCLYTPYDSCLSYQWYVNDTAIYGQTDTIICVTDTGDYHVVVWNDCDTVSSNDFLLSYYPLMSLSFALTAISCHDSCDGGIRAFVFNGTGPFSYHWSNGGSTNRIDDICAGTYYLTVTDANGCSVIDNAVLTEPPALNVNITCSCNSFFCVLTANVTGGTSGYTYLWSGSQTTPSVFLGLGSFRSYCVTVTDNMGCIATDCISSIYCKSIKSALSNEISIETESASLRIYPNPANDILNINSNNLNQESVKISLLDITGKIIGIIHQGSLEMDKVQYDCSYLKAGTYFIRCEVGETIINEKIFIY